MSETTEDRAAEALESARQVLDAWRDELRVPSRWSRYLELQGQSHGLPAHNVGLIFEQNREREVRVLGDEPPMIGHLASWNGLGRAVKRGEKGFAVLAERAVRDRFAVAPETGEARRLEKGERPGAGEKLEVRDVQSTVKVQHVFDVSQTKGRDLPAVGFIPTPGGTEIQSEQLRGFLEETVASCSSKGEVRRSSAFADLSEQPLTELDNWQAAMVAAETLAHRALHGRPPGRYLTRERKDIEAASVAVIVAAAHGIPATSRNMTEQYREMVRDWLVAAPVSEIAATQDRVQQVAHQMIEASPVPHHSGGGLSSVYAARRAEQSTELARQAAREPVGQQLEAGRTL